MMAIAQPLGKSARFDVDTVRMAAEGKWRYILSRLKIDVPASAKRHGPCPTCGGKDRFRFDDRDGKGSWFCNQCTPKSGDGFALVRNVRRCDFSEAVQLVADAIGLPPVNGEVKPRIERTYDYTDADGQLLFQVVRFKPKDFRQRRPDGNGGWIWNLKDLTPVLYRLPDVVAASQVLILEGEKDVDTAYQLGLPEGWAATCNPMGAEKWRDSYSDSLTGKGVVILPDADEPGERHGAQAARSLQGKAAHLLRLTLPDGCHDLSEWAAGRTREEFHSLVNSAIPWPHDGQSHIVSGVSVSGSDEWPELSPVKAELLPVEPLHLSIVPASFQAWVEDVSNRMQCPPDFIAAGMLVMAGAVVGAGCAIRPKKHDDWTVVPNLWGGVVGRPSMLKTPAISEAMKPLEHLERVAKQEYDAAMKDYGAEVEEYKARREALQAEMRQAAKGKRSTGGSAIQTMDSLKYDFAQLEEPKSPVWRRYKTNDATIEKMADLQADNPRGLLLFRDELIGLFATWDKEGHESDRAFYLEAWNGVRSYTSDRIGRGTIYVENLCVSLFGGIQPSKLISYLHAAIRGWNNDGMVQRLQLLVYPDEPKTWTLTDDPINARAKQQAYQVVQRLASMDFRSYGAFSEEGEPIPYYRFNEAGQTVFYEWLEDLETKLRQGNDEPVLLEHFGKYRSLMPALALLFHLLGLADGAPAGQVSKESAQQAAAWCEYLESHARRIYGLVTNVTTQAAARLALKLKQGALPAVFSVRDVYRKEWSLLDDRQVIENACDELESLGWLRAKVTPSAFGQRGKTEYVTNPKVRG